MSITIVSAPCRRPPASTTAVQRQVESTVVGEDGAIGLDFANILLGQRLMNLSAKTGEKGIQDETADRLGQTDAGEVDAASILATLGLVTQQAASTSDQPSASAAGSATSDSTTRLAQVGTGAVTEKPLKSDAMPQAESPVLGATADSDNAPAKLAVTPPSPKTR